MSVHALQIVTLVLLSLLLITHDTVPLGRWNNVGKDGSGKRDLGGVFLNAAVGLIPLCFAWTNRHAGSASAGQQVIAVVLAVTLIGAAVSWWIPWLFGSSKAWREKLQRISGGTVTFLPYRNGVNPNALHCLVHLLTLLGLSESLYMLRS